MAGNQIKRKYPKPPSEADPAVALQLRDRAHEIIESRGGRDRLSPLQLGTVDRYVVLEVFVQSWERYFLDAGLVTRQGRVRSGFAPGYLAALTHLMRLASIIGLDRAEEKPIYNSPADWLESFAAETHEHDGDDSTVDTNTAARDDPRDEDIES